MKKNTQNIFKTLILAVIFILIIVISSCTDTNSSPVLCNVKLDYDNSIDFDKPSFISNISELKDITLFLFKFMKENDIIIVYYIKWGKYEEVL